MTTTKKDIQIEMFLNLDRDSKENIDSELTLNLELAIRPVQSLENMIPISTTRKQ